MITGDRSRGGLSTLNANSKRVNDLVRSQTPTLTTNRPAPPQHFMDNPAALDIWDRFINGLEKIRVLLESDQLIAEIYVSAAIRKQQAEQYLIDPDTGQPVLSYKNRTKYSTNPLLSVIQRCEQTMVQCLRECGLTPNSRIKVNITSDSDSDKLSDFLDAV